MHGRARDSWLQGAQLSFRAIVGSDQIRVAQIGELQQRGPNFGAYSRNCINLTNSFCILVLYIVTNIKTLRSDRPKDSKTQTRCLDSHQFEWSSQTLYIHISGKRQRDVI